ncbi:MAG: tail fiber protein [Halobacteriales archaeon]|nr:tail fiber protein [Halobacteriales archaeon]
MAINIETTFTDSVTVVTAAWLNLLQEHLAGLANIKLSKPTSTQIRIEGSDDDDVASLYIEGQQRFRDSNLSFTFSGEASGTYVVYLTANEPNDSFGIDVRLSGTPTDDYYRRIGTVTWNGSAITNIRREVGRGVRHDHLPLDGSGTVAHADLTGLASGDPHTQYMHPDARRDFTARVSGVAPVAGSDLVTKGYVDGIVVPGLPIGTIMPFAGGSVPSGWLLCDGSSKSTSTYSTLHGVIGYTFGGAGSSFNVPDLQQTFALGKAAAGTGSTLGGTGGSWSHTHTQPSHTHLTSAHTHGTSAHTHSIPTTGSSGSHTHTQGSTGSTGSHTHSGPSHSHSDGSLAVGATGGAIVGSQHGSQATAGLYAENDVDSASDNSSHSHSDGSLTSSVYGAVCGTTSSSTASHYHYAAGNAYEHTHSSGTMTGSTGSAGTGSTSSDGSHSHTNPTTGSGGSHTHAGGTSGSASPSTNSGGGGNTGSDGNDVTGGANPPYIVMNYIIRAS